MSEFLKGNYEVKKQVRERPGKKGTSKELSEELRQRALASISGSMVYVERTELAWDGDAEGDTDAEPEPDNDAE